MKKRILSFGFPATHKLISPLAHFANQESISDYDAFAFDPTALSGTAWDQAVFERRKRELRDLVTVKGGIIICSLRAERMVNVASAGYGSMYRWLDQVWPQALSFIQQNLRAGQGTQWKLVPTAKGVSSGYFRVLQNNLLFEAFLESPTEGFGGTVFAVNSVGYPVAVEFVIGAGRLCFVPNPSDVSGERVGAAIVRVIEAHFGGPAEIDAPTWANDVVVPGADVNDAKISELEEAKEQLEARVSALKLKRSELLTYRSLLFGYGKTVLEPVVRQALRELGFAVLDPDEYTGEWDVQMRDEAAGTSAIGEIEGSDDAIEVGKFRQLLNYFQTEVIDGRIHKAILIGNGYKSHEPSSTERQNQFTEHVLRGAKQFGFCLLPTSHLFNAVCAVLESHGDEALKVEIRSSILSTVGVWTFARGSNLGTRAAVSTAGEAATSTA